MDILYKMVYALLHKNAKIMNNIIIKLKNANVKPDIR